ncbi:hypothetical protein DITRI_Ditri10aG0152600 [Diplodiscus trichospermus]
MVFFFATVCSIWLRKNEVIFNNKVFSVENLVDIVKLRAAFWAKAKWPTIPAGVLEISMQPCLVSVPSKDPAPRGQVVWTRPPMGWLKFNVDGVAQSQPGLGGIGGVLRNHESWVLMVFSKSIGLVDSNMAEILVVKEALSLFSSSQWSQSSSLII